MAIQSDVGPRSGGVYTAGTGISIASRVISSTVSAPTYTPGTGINISANVISCTLSYSAGSGISITSGSIAVKAGTGINLVGANVNVAGYAGIIRLNSGASMSSTLTYLFDGGGTDIGIAVSTSDIYMRRWLTIESFAEQLRLKYNATEYLSCTISAYTTAFAFTSTQALPMFTFNQHMNVAAAAPGAVGSPDYRRYAYSATRIGDFNLLYGSNNNASFGIWFNGGGFVLGSPVIGADTMANLGGTGWKIGNLTSTTRFATWNTVSNGVFGAALFEGTGNTYSAMSIGVNTSFVNTQLTVKAQHATNITSILDLKDNTGAMVMTVLANGTVGIGTNTPTASSLLDLKSTTLCFLPPRHTTAQRTAVSTPAAGSIVYDSTIGKLFVYTTAWQQITSV